MIIVHFSVLQIRLIWRAREAYRILREEACPAVLHKAPGPPGPGRFVFSALLVYHMNVFFDGCHPPAVRFAGVPDAVFCDGCLPLSRASIPYGGRLVKGGGLCYTVPKSGKGAAP